MEADQRALSLIQQTVDIYGRKFVVSHLENASPGQWSVEALDRLLRRRPSPLLAASELTALRDLLPSPQRGRKASFDFIDLFAGIGGIRRGFEGIGGRCVFTSEWNKESVRTYKANYYCDPNSHTFNDDIRKVTLSDREDIAEAEAYRHINSAVPDHQVLLAGFPCQPFSIAGVSKKNSMGRAHGFECKTQGTLFFDVARILAAKRPSAFVLENVKNLKSHDQGRTFKVITETLAELGYWVADVDASGPGDPKVIDGRHFVPQHRERIVLVGFRKDLGVQDGFTLRDIAQYFPQRRPSLGDLLEPEVDPKYTLTPKMWEYLFNYSIKHKSKGNGFGYGLVKETDTTRTLSGRYFKDGSEILLDLGFDPQLDLHDPANMRNRPRRLTPRECSRLMGFDAPGGAAFRIPVSDTQAYRQFGNSVVVPVFAAVASLMKSRILEAKALTDDQQSMAA
ncbi:DNA-cytosine methyltransferase [Paraburkholderia domus]|uniref:DNA (cytosine-5-)-methyltransferase n=1 Tax=Paraburkholderia domus TaxID=2793075 RepID=UPI0019144E42|nr:DNA (cytosine-5-)-methyltransferase [Paraburkholderia domus]MBK5052836.1 DNA (cytosine-5-)-methyltransferase [Burkholderia sp. R-70006]CAE6821161.1 DNA-cytosine methyltransferase [Paraburkholderia domus]